MLNTVNFKQNTKNCIPQWKSLLVWPQRNTVFKQLHVSIEHFWTLNDSQPSVIQTYGAFIDNFDTSHKLIDLVKQKPISFSFTCEFEYGYKKAAIFKWFHVPHRESVRLAFLGNSVPSVRTLTFATLQHLVISLLKNSYHIKHFPLFHYDN